MEYQRFSEFAIAAIRKQLDKVLAANPKIPIDADYKSLSELVAKEKEEKKPDVVKKTA